MLVTRPLPMQVICIIVVVYCCLLFIVVYCFYSVGNTALTYACCGGFEEVVKVLLENQATVEHQNENGHTPLMEAASCGHVGELPFQLLRPLN